MRIVHLDSHKKSTKRVLQVFLAKQISSSSIFFFYNFFSRKPILPSNQFVVIMIILLIQNKKISSSFISLIHIFQFFLCCREKSRSQSSRETGFSFSYGKVEALLGLIAPLDEINRVSKFDNSLSFGAKQKSLGQIFFFVMIF